MYIHAVIDCAIIHNEPIESVLARVFYVAIFFITVKIHGLGPDIRTVHTSPATPLSLLCNPKIHNSGKEYVCAAAVHSVTNEGKHSER